MSTSVYQRVQPRFEPWILDPRVIWSRWAPPTSNEIKDELFNQEINMKKAIKKEDYRGWNFLQSLSNTTKNEDEKVYVHPAVKKSASLLTERSLLMCTESLGSENGEELISISTSFNSEISEKYDHNNRITCFGVRKRWSCVTSFPPPLTTIRGGFSSGVNVKCQKEDGRLVIKAVSSYMTHQSCFKAERRDGRLKLDFLNDDDENNDHDDDGGKSDEEEDYNDE